MPTMKSMVRSGSSEMLSTKALNFGVSSALAR